MDHFLRDHRQHQSYNPLQPTSSGLTRYQSAPSSYFSSFLDSRDFCEEFLNRPSSPETERIFSRFLANSGGTTSDNVSNHQDLYTAKQDSTARDAAPPTQVNRQQEQVMASINGSDSRLHQQQQRRRRRSGNQSTASQSFFEDHNQSTLPLPDQNSGSGIDYKAVTSMGTERLPQMKTAGGNNSILVRHSSSPAGLFSNLNSEIENGYAVLRGMGDLGAGNREESFPAASRPPCYSGQMSPTSQIGNKTTAENGMDNDGFGDARGSNYVTGFTLGSWDNSATIFVGAKGLTGDSRTFSGLDTCETQNLETGNRPPMLAHRLSFPKSPAEISAIENFVQFQDSVPCKIRAKRGCATHPRSIAERVRRTRISERMRKLEDIVPYMDKQTNTADMLDLAVDYIKDLQRQVKVLSENRAKCSCTIKQQE